MAIMADENMDLRQGRVQKENSDPKYLLYFYLGPGLPLSLSLSGAGAVRQPPRYWH